MNTTLTKAAPIQEQGISNLYTNDIISAIRQQAKIYRINEQEGVLYLPDDFPRELEEAWGK